MIKPNNYPPARKSDQVDDYHGVKVADPYRWLEDLDSEETRKWIEAENKLSFGYLAAIPQRNDAQGAADQALELRKVRHPVSRKGTVTSTYATAACRTRPCSTP